MGGFRDAPMMSTVIIGDSCYGNAPITDIGTFPKNTKNTNFDILA